MLLDKTCDLQWNCDRELRLRNYGNHCELSTRKILQYLGGRRPLIASHATRKHRSRRRLGNHRTHSLNIRDLRNSWSQIIPARGMRAWEHKPIQSHCPHLLWKASKRTQKPSSPLHHGNRIPAHTLLMYVADHTWTHTTICFTSRLNEFCETMNLRAKPHHVVKY